MKLDLNKDFEKLLKKHQLNNAFMVCLEEDNIKMLVERPSDSKDFIKQLGRLLSITSLETNNISSVCDVLEEHIKKSKLLKAEDNLSLKDKKLLKKIRKDKNLEVKNKNYEKAALLRDQELALLGVKSSIPDEFSNMGVNSIKKYISYMENYIKNFEKD